MSAWYYYEDGTVRGPVSSAELHEHVEENTLVCRAGRDDWKFAREISLDPPDPPAEESSSDETLPPQLEPTLETLDTLCRHASNTHLLEEYRSHWEAYDPAERAILRDHLVKRGLIAPRGGSG